MGKPKSINTDLQEGILTITLQTSTTPNTLCTTCVNELSEVIQEVYDNNDIKSVIITGAGEADFFTGAPLQEIQALNELNGRKFAEQGQETLALIENCHKPILAIINGSAIDVGFELAMACHLRIATENVNFGLPAVAAGLIPSFGGTQRLPHLIGKTKALELMMTGDPLSAAEAASLGMLNYVTQDKEQALSKGRALLQKIMVQDALTVGMLINCTNAAYNPQENGFQTEANCFAGCCKPKDSDEGSILSAS